jgi:hypothetical protein
MKNSFAFAGVNSPIDIFKDIIDCDKLKSLDRIDRNQSASSIDSEEAPKERYIEFIKQRMRQ